MLNCRCPGGLCLQISVGFSSPQRRALSHAGRSSAPEAWLLGAGWLLCVARPCPLLSGCLSFSLLQLGGMAAVVPPSCADGERVLMCLHSSGDRLPRDREPLSPLCLSGGISCPSLPGTLVGVGG